MARGFADGLGRRANEIIIESSVQPSLTDHARFKLSADVATASPRPGGGSRGGLRRSSIRAAWRPGPVAGCHGLAGHPRDPAG